MIKKFGWGVHQAKVVYSSGAPAFVTDQGLQIEIEGGEWGAQLRHLHVHPVWVANVDCVWLCLVFVGKVSNVAEFQIADLAAGGNQFYRVAPGKNLLYMAPLVPFVGLAGLGIVPLMADFIDDSAPKVEAGETMTILIVPAFVAGGVPAMANAPAVITANVFGGDIIQTSTPTPKAISSERV